MGVFEFFEQGDHFLDDVELLGTIEDEFLADEDLAVGLSHFLELSERVRFLHFDYLGFLHLLIYRKAY